jgi:outer membrane biosynthesis protein TonB
MRLDVLGWCVRDASGLAPAGLYSVLQGINDKIISASRRIEGLPGMAGVDYADQSGEILKVIDDLAVLLRYVSDLPDDIANRLDQPLFEAFANGPAQAISQIRAEDLTTANTPWVTSTVSAADALPGVTPGTVYAESLISFDDFFGSSSQESQISYFADLFKADYDAWEQYNLDQGVDFDDYLAQVLASGEFDHEGYHPVQSFVSSVLDFTIVWPIYKSIVGHDPITGEDLEAWERAVGAGMAAVDLAALLIAIPSGGASVAGAVVARTVVRELLVNALATGVSLLTYDMAVALDLQPWLATLAAMGVGLGVSVAGTRAVIKRLNAAGKPIGDPIEIDLTKPKTPQPEPPPPKGVDPDDPWPGGGLAADVIPGKPPAITDIPSVRPPDPPPPPTQLPEPDPAPITPEKPKTKPRPESEVTEMKPADLMAELAASGEKYTADAVVMVTKTPEGKLVWLETGSSSSGLGHILEQHATQFAEKGVPAGEIPDYLQAALSDGKVVGYQRKRIPPRAVYEFTWKGETHQVAISVGDNGFIVGANPKSKPAG